VFSKIKKNIKNQAKIFFFVPKDAQLFTPKENKE
jgi:hypothetical protein